MSKEKAPRVPTTLIKMLCKGRWMDTPKKPILQIEHVGLIVEVTDPTAKVMMESGKGVLYKGDMGPGDVDKLTKQEQDIADAFELEAMAKKEAAKAVPAAK